MCPVSSTWKRSQEKKKKTSKTIECAKKFVTQKDEPKKCRKKTKVWIVQ